MKGAQVRCSGLARRQGVLQQAVGGLTSPRGGGKYEQELLSALQQLLEKFGPSPEPARPSRREKASSSRTNPRAARTKVRANRACTHSPFQKFLPVKSIGFQNTKLNVKATSTRPGSNQTNYLPKLVELASALHGDHLVIINRKGKPCFLHDDDLILA